MQDEQAKNEPADGFDGAAKKVVATHVDWDLSLPRVHGIHVQPLHRVGASMVAVLAVVEPCGGESVARRARAWSLHK